MSDLAIDIAAMIAFPIVFVVSVVNGDYAMSLLTIVVLVTYGRLREVERKR
jgi:hypothetical protein